VARLVSYIVSVVRAGSLIAASELAEYAETDPDLVWVPDTNDASSGYLEWTGEANVDRAALLLDDGRISTNRTPRGPDLPKLRDVAQFLGADVFGEEGERIDPSELVDDGEVELPGCRNVLWGLAIIAFWVFIYWRFS
jgi:hypothetical protein